MVGNLARHLFSHFTLVKSGLRKMKLQKFLLSKCKADRMLRAVKDWELFCLRTPLIKTVMRLFTAASNYSGLWLCSIDYDSHE